MEDAILIMSHQPDMAAYVTLLVCQYFFSLFSSSLFFINFNFSVTGCMGSGCMHEYESQCMGAVNHVVIGDHKAGGNGPSSPWYTP